MKTNIAIAATAALLATAVPALSADFNYDPPIFVEKMPDYVPVEIGTGWYLRGDVTYNVSRPTYNLGVGSGNNRFGGGLGFGYQFTDFLRLDTTINYVGYDRYRTGPLSGGHSLWTAMATGYIDLGTVVGVTPYIGGGIGAAHARTLFDQGIQGQPGFGYNETGFAYTLNAGAAYRVTDNLSVDLGYQYLSAPNLRRFDYAAGVERRGIAHHQIRAGLRYELW
ncbi:MAG: outer membrane protein [Rhizobiaceae bacterium]